MLEDAVRWSDKAWKVMPSTESMPDTDRYGFNEAQLNRVARMNWQQIRLFEEWAYPQIPGPSDAHDDARPSDTHHDARPSDAHDDAHHDARSSDTHHDARPSDTHHDARIGDTRHDARRWQWTCVEWTTDSSDTITAFRDRYQKVEADDDIDMVPPWATLHGTVRFEFDPKKWWDILKEHSIDYTARQNLYLLAQMSDVGPFHALELITKLQHKMPHHGLDNPSRWLHSCTSKAHHELSQDLNLHR